MKEMWNSITLLRFPFSFFLLPISLFSFEYIKPEFSAQLVLVLVIWHLLVFPSSNGYNSYNDNDEGPIGGLSAPPKPTKSLLYLTNILDGAAILLSLAVNIPFACFVTLYIIASRLYSYRRVRLKKYPIGGFLVVFVFQGAWVFCANVLALSSSNLFTDSEVIAAAVASSFFIGTIYPLTQIYQHESDRSDGVITLSMFLGIRGTFLFSAIMFLCATLMIFFSFHQRHSPGNFWLFNLIMLPSTLFFLLWAGRSFQNRSLANFKNTMIMLVMSSVLNNLFFIIILLK